MDSAGSHLPPKGPLGLVYSAAIGALRIVGLWVPAKFRARWLEEWQGELLHELEQARGRSGRRRRVTLLRRVLGALRDAQALRHLDRSGPVRKSTPSPSGGNARGSRNLRSGGRAGLAAWADEVKLAVRSLRQQPGFAGLAIVSLAIGIGANATVFSAIDVALFRPLPYPNAQRLVTVRQFNTARGYQRDPTYAEFRRWKERANASVDALVAETTRAVDLTGGEQFDEGIGAQLVSLDFLPLLGADIAWGRGFSAADYDADASPVVILRHDLWQNRFNGDADVLGRTLEIDRTAHTIVGVLAPGFLFDFEQDVWLPLRAQGAGPAVVDADHIVDVVARLREDARREHLAAELEAIEAGAASPSNDDGADGGGNIAVPVVEPLRAMLGWVFVNLAPVMLVVGFVVLLVCANLAGLFLVRTTNRRQEMVVRAALGAGRWRLARLVFTEILIIAIAGASLATLLAWWGITVMVQAQFLSVHHAGPRFELRTVVFVFGLALVAGVLAALRPAYSAIRADIGTALRDGNHQFSRGRAHTVTQRALVIFQIACSLLLLTGAGLVTKSVLRMQQQDPGYDPDNLLRVEITIPEGTYESVPQRMSLVDELVERMRSVPGVIAASAFTSGGNLHFRATDAEGGVTLEGDSQRLAAEINQLSSYTYVDRNYFATLRVPVLRGRAFMETDQRGGAPVAIVNEAAARRWWPESGGEVLGKRFKLGPPSAPVPWITVVGVSGTTVNLILPPRPHVYLPLAQRESLRWAYFYLRTRGEPVASFPALRVAVAGIDPNLWLEDPSSIAADRARRLHRERRNAQVLAAFAAFGLMLAALGVYGVVAYGVSLRTREIGVRMALGADSAQVLAAIARESVALTATGIAVGLTLAAALSRLLESMLFGVSPLDPTVFTAMSIVLGVFAAAATYLPARRALQVDPVVALRSS